MVNTLQVGQKVYVSRYTSYDRHYVLAEVVKVTPSGQSDIQFPSGTIQRFLNTGREAGRGDTRYYYEIDEAMTVEQRSEELAKKERIKTAVMVCNDIKLSEHLRPAYGKEGLTQELDRLQKLIDAARVAVEAI